MSALTDTLTKLFASGTQVSDATSAGLDNDLLLSISNLDKAGIDYDAAATGDATADAVGAALVQIAEQINAVNPALTPDQETAFDTSFSTIIRGSNDAQTAAGKALFIASLHYELSHEKRNAYVNSRLAKIPAGQ